MLDITSKIKDLIKVAGTNLGFDLAVVSLEHPDDLKNGDYSTNVALAYAKALGKPPREIAEQIKNAILQLEKAINYANSIGGHNCF
mgnify:CR=1 FL=1